MQSSNVPVETADRLSRKRAWLAGIATLGFAAVQAVTRPVFVSGSNSAVHPKFTMWALNAVILLALLATGGCVLRGAGIRSLINDEVSTMHRRTAVAAGFWVAMAASLCMYFAPDVVGLSARQAAYLVVTCSTVAALLTFSYLEVRSHRDA